MVQVKTASATNSAVNASLQNFSRGSANCFLNRPWYVLWDPEMADVGYGTIYAREYRYYAVTSSSEFMADLPE